MQLRLPFFLASVLLLSTSAPSALAAEASSFLAPPALGDGLPVAPANSVPLNPELLSNLEAKVGDGTLARITSVLVAHDGKLVYEGYFNGAERDTLHDVRS